jgi:hypothetical protein
LQIADYTLQMTASEVAEERITIEVRALSKAVFGREYELEVAAAAALLEKNSTVEEIFLKARERAEEAGVEVPKESAVRTSLERLVAATALTGVPSPRPGLSGYFEPRSDSAFWDFALELCQAARGRPGHA